MAIAAAWAALAILGMAVLSFITCVWCTRGVCTNTVRKFAMKADLWERGGGGGECLTAPAYSTAPGLSVRRSTVASDDEIRARPRESREITSTAALRLQTHGADLVLPWPKSSPRVHVLHGGGLQQPHLIEARINNTRREGDHYLIVAYTRRSPGWRRKEKHEEVCFAITDLSLLLAEYTPLHSFLVSSYGYIPVVPSSGDVPVRLNSRN